MAECKERILDTSDNTGARFQYNVTSVKAGWVDRYVLLQPDSMTPMEAHDPSAGTLPLVFERIEDAERFKEGLAENIAEIIQHSSGLPFDQALTFAKNESTDGLIPAIPSNGTMSVDQFVYLVSF